MTAGNDRTDMTKDNHPAAKDLIKVPSPPVRETSQSLEVSGPPIPSQRGKPALSKRGIRIGRPVRIGGLLLLVLIATFLAWRFQRAKVVTVVRPIRTNITETIASSGRVAGVTETLVGAQATGVVETLMVRKGERVAKGQRLAILKNNVAEAQVAQAEQAINTAKAQLSQTSRGPLTSEVEAAAEQVKQAEALVVQQEAAIAQARQSVAQIANQLGQLTAQRDLAAKQLQRNQSLDKEGIVARAEMDRLRTDVRLANDRIAAQQQAVHLAETNVQAAQAGLMSAEANVRAQAARLRTLETGARPEDVQVARQRLQDAELALNVTRQQAGNAVVKAPFAGIVVAINAELGQAVGSQGVLRLVSGDLEVRLDVDESNLADLSVGQAAIISSSTFRNSTFEGKVSEIGAVVDAARGTVQVTVVPVNPPDWLRPGQTVNVNIVTAKSVERLIIPATAVARTRDQNVVFVFANGRALEKTIVSRPPTGEGVPVLAGLTAEDHIIADAAGIKAGDSVQVARGGVEAKQ
jgi:HlyD family secretion protein